MPIQDIDNAIRNLRNAIVSNISGTGSSATPSTGSGSPSRNWYYNDLDEEFANRNKSKWEKQWERYDEWANRDNDRQKQTYVKELKTKAVVSELTQLAKGISDTIISFRKLSNELTLNRIEQEKIRATYGKTLELETQKAQNEIAKRTIETQKKIALDMTSAVIGVVTDGIQAGSYAAYEKRIEAENAMKNLQLDNLKTRLTLERRLEQENMSFYQKMRSNELSRSVTEAQIINQALGAGGKIAGNFGPYGAAIGAVADIAGSQYQTTAEIRKSRVEAQIAAKLEVINKDYEMYANQLEYTTEIQKAYNDYMKEMQLVASRTAKTIEGWVDKTDNSVSEMMRSFGYFGTQFSSNKNIAMTSGIAGWAARSGLSMDSVTKMISGYQSETGRMGILSEMDVAAIGLIDKYVGEEGYIMKVSGIMNDFNKSIYDTSTMSSKHMTNVARQGLSLRKYAMDVEKYLSLANKYNFKGGTEGVMKMAEYMQKTKGSMEEINSVVSKFRGGGDISKVLETSAQLNVLGGNAALYSDPLGMLYDSYMDMEGLMKRVQSMTAEFGTFNRGTGEMQFGMAERMAMEMISQITGQDVSTMSKQINAANRRKQVLAALSGKDLTNEQKEFIAQNASFNTTTGEWEVSVGKNKRGVSGLESGDVEGIIPKETEEDIMRITSDVSSMNDALKKILGFEESRKLAETIGQYQIIRDFYYDYQRTNAEKIDEYQKVVDEFENHYGDDIRKALQGSVDSMASILNLDEQAKTQLMESFNDENTGINAANEKLQSILDTITTSGVVISGGQAYDEYQEAQKEFDTAKRNFESIKEDTPWYKRAFESTANFFAKLGGDNYDTQYTQAKENLKNKEEWFEEKKSDYQLFRGTNDALTYGSAYIPSANTITSSSDANLSWRKGDQVDTLFNGVAKNVNSIGAYVARTSGGGFSGGASRDMNVNVNFGGNARIDCNGSASGNVVDMIANDPFAIRKISEMVLTEISRYNDGRGTVNAYTNVGNIFS